MPFGDLHAFESKDENKIFSVRKRLFGKRLRVLILVQMSFRHFSLVEEALQLDVYSFSSFA